MSKDILNNLQIDPCLTKPGGKGVPEDVAAKARKKDWVLIKIGLQQDLIVAISGNPLDSLIKCALVLHIAVTVHKDEIIVSIDSRLAFDTVFFLISALHLKCFLNPDGQEGLGAPSFGWGFRPRSGTYLMNVYSVVKLR